MYTKYEKARIIGARAFQLALGSPPLIKVNPTDEPVTVAMKEFEAGVIPFVVKRKLSASLS